MLKYSMEPVVDPYDLAEAIQEKFGDTSLGTYADNMEFALFGEDYTNYTCQSYTFDCEPTPSYGVDEEMAQIRSYANKILREAFPDRTSVLISIYW